MPSEAHGTVVQLAESHGHPETRAALLEHVAAHGPDMHPRWWTDPRRAEGPPARLRRVVLRTPMLPTAVEFFGGILQGEIERESAQRVDLVWPRGARIGLEHRPDAPRRRRPARGGGSGRRAHRGRDALRSRVVPRSPVRSTTDARAGRPRSGRLSRSPRAAPGGHADHADERQGTADDDSPAVRPSTTNANNASRHDNVGSRRGAVVCTVAANQGDERCRGRGLGDWRWLDSSTPDGIARGIAARYASRRGETASVETALDSDRLPATGTRTGRRRTPASRAHRRRRAARSTSSNALAQRRLGRPEAPAETWSSKIPRLVPTACIAVSGSVQTDRRSVVTTGYASRACGEDSDARPIFSW